MQLVLCVCAFHCSMLFYIRDLSILRYRYLLGVLEPISCEFQQMTVVNFLENQESYADSHH